MDPIWSPRSKDFLWCIRNARLLTCFPLPGPCWCPWEHSDQTWHTKRTTSAKHGGTGVGRVMALNLHFPWFCDRWSVTVCRCWFTCAYYVCWEGRHQGFPDAPHDSGLPDSRAGQASSCSSSSYSRPPLLQSTQITDLLVVINCLSGCW